MSRLRFISAGAGSGKTFALTHILGEELQKGNVRPSGVIATTFTVKAASEFRERVRQHLLAHGLFDLANAMGQARIGTVNSICGELLERFAFENGLAPALQVIDEDQAKVLMKKSIDDVLTSETINEMLGLSMRLSIDDWQADLRHLVVEVRANQIDLGLLPTMAVRNAESLLEKFGSPYAQDLSAQLLDCIEIILKDLKPHLEDSKTPKITKDYFQFAHNFKNDLKAKRASWAQWIKFSKSEPGKKAKTSEVEDAQKLAAQCTAHPLLHADIRAYLKILFDTCAIIIERYQARKKELGVVDFTDQEALFLEMLENQDVAAVLSEELDLLLVDEFQDTSPMQLALFLKLSAFSKQSYFVGDIKQAIYGFRGSSPELMQRLLAVFPEIGGEVQILDKSWRSRPQLVKLVNAVFKDAFSGTLREEEVILTAQRKEVCASPAFANWTLEGRNEGERFQALANGVQELVASKMIIPCGGLTSRTLCYGDIAILARSNDGVDKIAAALRQTGVPVATSSAGLLKTPEATLALACLRYVINKGDTLAPAEIVSLADCAEPEEWLEDRLAYLANHDENSAWPETGPDAHPLLSIISTLRERLVVLTPHEMVRAVIVECGLPKLIMQWCVSEEMARLRLANLEALIGFAEQYQLTCRSLRDTATITGFLVWLHEIAEADADELATPALDAVSVMTCHKAKGLEWPVVILTELEKNIRSGVWSIFTYSRDGFQADEPLARRFIHYWPWPFGQQVTGINALGAIETSSEYIECLALAEEEAKRLLYVGMTRPRDMLILAHNPKSRSSNPWIQTLGADWLIPTDEPKAPLILPDGDTISSETRILTSEDSVPCDAACQALGWFKYNAKRNDFPALYVSPSRIEGRTTTIVSQEVVGAPMHVKPGKLDWSIAGDALHACLAASFTDFSSPLSKDEVQMILTKFGVTEAIKTCEVLDQIASVHTWVQTRWPNGYSRAEVPVSCVMDAGQTLQGWIDLLIETPEGFVVIDHKSSMGKSSRLQDIANAYSAQLDAYARAITTLTNKIVVEKWLFLPVMGIAMRIA